MADATTTTVGLSPATHDLLRRLQDEGIVNELTDGYRFAVALALRDNVAPVPVSSRQTFVNIGTLDPDGTLSIAVRCIRGETDDPYKVIEGLAEAAIPLLHEIAATGVSSIIDLLPVPE